MKTASIADVKKALQALEPSAIRDLCTRLARFKNENKALLSYLLFDALDEEAYIHEVNEEIRLLFRELAPRNVYYTKKTLRKIVRFANRQIRYSGLKKTEIEIRLCFCQKMREHKVPLAAGTVLFTIYEQQRKKIEAALSALPADLQFDYERDMRDLQPLSNPR